MKIGFPKAINSPESFNEVFFLFLSDPIFLGLRSWTKGPCLCFSLLILAIVFSSGQKSTLSKHKTFVHYVQILTSRSVVTANGYKGCSLSQQLNDLKSNSRSSEQATDSSEGLHHQGKTLETSLWSGGNPGLYFLINTFLCSVPYCSSAFFLFVTE